MTYIRSNFNNVNNIVGLMQMFGGTGNSSAAMISSIFNLASIDRTNVNNTKAARYNFITQIVLNYAPMLFNGAINVIGGAIAAGKAQRYEAPESQETQETPEPQNAPEPQDVQDPTKASEIEEQETPVVNKDLLISKIMEAVDMKDSEALKRDLLTKYNVMTSVAEQNKETLDLDEIQTRLTNYAKGWKFNQFQVKASLDLDAPEYQSDCSKAKTMEELKAAYNQFAKEYIEFYDQDENNKIEIEEMFYQELIEHYSLRDRMSTAEAKKKALETLENYKTNNYGLLNNGTINLPNDGSDEATLYSLILGKLTRMEQTLNIDNNAAFDQEEIAIYLNAMASINDKGNNISTSDSKLMETASVDTETEVFENILKAAQNFLS